jgi:hypothetical protein
MKTTSKVILGLAMAATAFTGLVGTAHAQEHEAVLSYNQMNVDVNGVGDFEGNGVTLESRGIYDSGLRYDLAYTSVDVDTVGDMTFGELDVRYTPNTFGVAGTFTSAEGADDTLALGVAAEYFTANYEAYATLTSDVDNFFQDFALEVGGRYHVTENVTLIAEYNDTWVEGADTDASAEVAARYTLANNTFVQAGYGTTISADTTDLSIYSLGLGFNF